MCAKLTNKRRRTIKLRKKRGGGQSGPKPGSNRTQHSLRMKRRKSQPVIGLVSTRVAQHARQATPQTSQKNLAQSRRASRSPQVRRRRPDNKLPSLPPGVQPRRPAFAQQKFYSTVKMTSNSKSPSDYTVINNTTPQSPRRRPSRRTSQKFYSALQHKTSS